MKAAGGQLRWVGVAPAVALLVVLVLSLSSCVPVSSTRSGRALISTDPGADSFDFVPEYDEILGGSGGGGLNDGGVFAPTDADPASLAPSFLSLGEKRRTGQRLHDMSHRIASLAFASHRRQQTAAAVAEQQQQQQQQEQEQEQEQERSTAEPEQTLQLVDHLEGDDEFAKKQLEAKAAETVSIPYKPEVTVVDMFPADAEANSPDTLSRSQWLPRFVSLLKHRQQELRNVTTSSTGAMKKLEAAGEGVTDLTKTGKTILERQIKEASKCFRVLYNNMVPEVVNRDFFPKKDQMEQRFRFHCKTYNTSKGVGYSYLSSYNIDNFYLPQWVAFRIERPVFGESIIPGKSVRHCHRRGFSCRFRRVKFNQINTPDAAYMMVKNAASKRSGISPWQNYRLGQFQLPSHFLDCRGKSATFVMTNAVPMLKYLFEYNWARADRGIRQYVARDVPNAPRGLEAEFFAKSDKYHPVYVVGGVHFSTSAYERFEWRYANEKPRTDKPIRFGAIPHGVWQAVLDPEKLAKKKPELATVAWYCNNVFKGPWPTVVDENMYANGPKLCEVMSLAKLKKIAGVVPFPELPEEAVKARPSAASWFLDDDF